MKPGHKLIAWIGGLIAASALLSVAAWIYLNRGDFGVKTDDLPKFRLTRVVRSQ